MEQAVQQWEQVDLLGALASAPPSAGLSAAVVEPPPVETPPVETPPVEAPVQPAQLPVAPAPGLAPPAISPPETGPQRRVAPPLSLPEFTAPAPRAMPLALERLLILDTETTALRPEDGDCIEVGAVLFAVASRAVLTQVSFLLPCATNDAEAINGIPAAVSQLAQPWREALHCFLAMVARADAILAHNAAFDRQWFGRGELPALDKPWICSMEDIRWPREKNLRATPSVRDL
ncbi:MAG: 3'-5' exonuclease, partial [Cyanobacteriota bacterium]|nr:3'-5' exonuclease [Cyanobacteriota bacterium]